MSNAFNTFSLTPSSGGMSAAKYLFSAIPATNSIEVLDVSDPSNITQAATFGNGTNTDNPQGIVIDTNRRILFATEAHDNAVQSWDITDPLNPTYLDNLTTGTSLDDPRKMALDVTRNILYVTCSDDYGVTSLDVSGEDITFLHKVDSSAIFGTVVGNQIYIDTDNMVMFRRNSTDTSIAYGNIAFPHNMSFSEYDQNTYVGTNTYGMSVLPDPKNQRVFWATYPGGGGIVKNLMSFNYGPQIDSSYTRNFTALSSENFTTNIAWSRWMVMDRVRGHLWSGGRQSGENQGNFYADISKNQLSNSITQLNMNSAGWNSASSHQPVYDPVSQVIYTMYSSDIYSYDVSNPTSPVLLDTYSGDNVMSDICLDIAGPSSTNAYSATDYY